MASAYYPMAISVQPSSILSIGDMKEALLHEVFPRCVEANHYERITLVQSALDDLAAKVGITDIRVIPYIVRDSE
jgi:hypothetical protein